MNEPIDPEKLKQLAQIHQTFQLLVMNAQLLVHHELLVEMLAKGQPQDAVKVTTDIHRRTAEHVNNLLRTTADHYPRGIGTFAALLEAWKKSHGI